MDTEKRLNELNERLRYVRDIFGARENENITLLATKLGDFQARERTLSEPERIRALAALEDLFAFLEKKLEAELTPMDKVRIVRHPQRICLKDILENVYDNYTEIGGRDEHSIDPAMLIARAYITRRKGKKVYNQPVMVIGQEKGHGQEFRNGGSVKPWGNAKALHYMKVAEIENIPIHTYVFTPGSYPVEDWPGAAQQIARNLYEMAALKVPVVSVFSEGGSGGAEAIGLADTRLMLSHGYYSVISPEGAAAIESGIRQGQRAPAELIETCARRLCITADDNLKNGYVDRIIQEPALGARVDDYGFFKQLRQEIIRATDEVVLSVKGIKLFRAMALRRRQRRGAPIDAEAIYVRWDLNTAARERLLSRRYAKFMRLSRHAFLDKRPAVKKACSACHDLGWSLYSFFRYDLWRKHHRRIAHAMAEMGAEVDVVKERVSRPWRRIFEKLGGGAAVPEANVERLTQLSAWEADGDAAEGDTAWRYVSPRAAEDRAVTCPNSEESGCLDLWAPDLFGDFAGVCSYCGHHFPMEYQWYLFNVFDERSVFEFNAEVESGNPLDYSGFDAKLEKAKQKLGRKSACMTFEAKVKGVKVVVAMLMAPFRGGSVGAAEGEKFIRAADRARKKHFPFLAYVHGTAGIRIQEGVNGVIQMPRCTMAVRRYIEAGGLYLVVYDTNSYAGPVASFLGCSPYQFAVRSANIGFAGPGVIKETTGLDIPPDYHRAYSALSRGHIQGIWDRRDIRNNLYQSLLTMGGRNLYYR
ncbi:MAG: acetyl-CoA carboxylase carboxyl transferase subunit alpha/beta [Desulfovibrionaceae bacterium]|jgi:acetyl-CoA carboxylase carboxyl transferase subunit beta|nr:acetyl-CoA carboxylase carboxyl transferase subunit alpha/beta [Desulfovibrionaceae bacterium]